ncbi:MAG TPA: patatin-like phospholipase family protein, partial [Bacteroidia bacterium]|nr:patatin-like phospholipase family protein [Bacteroidia bacterium]
MGKKFKILSIDGGGLRGVIPIIILQELEKRMKGKRIQDMFDLFAGTSTGGLITSALVVGDGNSQPMYNLDQILSIYTNRGKEIFPKKGWLGNFVNNISSLKNPTYKADGIDKVLRDMVDHKRMTNCIKPVFITAYDMYNNESVFFKSRQAATDPNCNIELYEVCRATSAGPTYLPAYDGNYGGKKRIYVDGGVFMNNPTVGAIVEVSRFHTDAIYNRPDLIFEDICVLSLGTGHYSADVAGKKVERWGA